MDETRPSPGHQGPPLWNRVTEALPGLRAGETDPGDDPELEALQAAILAVPGVVALHPGRLGELTTRLPGRRGRGISLTDELATVRLVLDADAPVRSTASAVRDLVAPHTSGSVRVLVEDVRGTA